MDVTPDTPTDLRARTLAGLGPVLRRTRWGMVWEQLARAFWPLVSLLALAVAALAFGAQDLMAGWSVGLRQGVVWAVLVALVLALVWGLSRLRRIRAAEVEARIDRSLPGQPLASLAEAQALGAGDPDSAALWAAHRRQLAVRAAAARPVPPDADLPRRDPLALRLAALTALALAGIFGQPARLAELPVLLRGGVIARADPTHSAQSWEGWAEPPAYTGKPAIYLNTVEGRALSLPEGSRLSFRLYGPPDEIGLRSTIGPVSADDPAQPDIRAAHSGRVEIAGAAFEITVLPDAAPTVALNGLAERRADGRLVQRFAAGDDHAVTRGRARIVLDLSAVDRRYGLATPPEPRAPLVYDLPLPAARARDQFTGTLTEDAAQHAFANLPVIVTLEVEDGLGQVGQSDPQLMDLPGRRFFQPVAAALIEMRRDLLWSRDNAPRVAQILRALTHRPEGFLDDTATYLALRGVIRRLEAGAMAPAARDELAATLWQAAIKLEDGGLSDALEQMQRAQERLSEAIRQGASPDEIQRLMDDLREATDAYTQMLAAREQGEDPADRFASQPQSQRISGDQIQQMMDEIQRLMEEGRMAEAQALLEQFNRMMQNLRVTQGQGSGEGQPGEMRDLGEALRRQQDLADEAFRQLQDSYRPLGQQEQQTPEDKGDLADRQRALREDLGRQRGLLPGGGTDAGEAARRRLDEAGEAMQEAERALRDGDPGAAIDRQADAIENLREGMRAMGEVLMARPAPGQRDRQSGEAVPGQPQDPLGRRLGEGGTITTPGELLDDESRAGRARRLMDEIRRRAGEQARPDDERGYLRRLLDAF